jgi:hypothetical protein
MSKLSTHQIRAMIAGIERTIGSHEGRPGTPSNVKKLTQSQTRLDSYRAELAEREAAEAAQDAEQNASQDDPTRVICDQCEGTGSITGATGARGCRACSGSGLTPARRAAVPIRAPRRKTTPASNHRQRAAAIQAAHATVRAELAGESVATTRRTEPDAELAVRLRDLLATYSLGTVLDVAWATDRELCQARNAAAAAEARTA